MEQQYSPPPDPSTWGDFWESALVLIKTDVTYKKEEGYIQGEFESLHPFGDWLSTQPSVPNDFKKEWANVKASSPLQKNYNPPLLIQSIDRLIAACWDVDHTRFDIFDFLRSPANGSSPFLNMLSQMKELAKNSDQTALKGMVYILDPEESPLPGFSFIRQLYGPLVPVSFQIQFSECWESIKKSVVNGKQEMWSIDQMIQFFKKIDW